MVELNWRKWLKWSEASSICSGGPATAPKWCRHPSHHGTALLGSKFTEMVSVAVLQHGLASVGHEETEATAFFEDRHRVQGSLFTLNSFVRTKIVKKFGQLSIPDEARLPRGSRRSNSGLGSFRRFEGTIETCSAKERHQWDATFSFFSFSFKNQFGTKLFWEAGDGQRFSREIVHHGPVTETYIRESSPAFSSTLSAGKIGKPPRNLAAASNEG